MQLESTLYFSGYFSVLLLLAFLYFGIGKNLLSLILRAIFLIIEKIDITSPSTFISQICTIIIIDGEATCLEGIAHIIIISVSYVVFVLMILYFAINSVYFGYMVFIQLRGKDKRGQI